MGDMFSDDSKRLGKHLSNMMMVWPISSIFCPIISGYLTSAFGIRVPLAIATAMYVANFFVTMLPSETLSAGKRKPFQIGMGTSPLTAVKLFTSGKRLRALGFLKLVDRYDLLLATCDLLLRPTWL